MVTLARLSKVKARCRTTEGKGWLGGTQKFVGTPGSNVLVSHIDAFEPLTGKRVWRVSTKHPILGALLSTGGDLLFAGDPEGNFNAFDLIYTMKGANAGPDFSTDIMGTFFYRTFFGQQLQLGNPTMGATVVAMMRRTHGLSISQYSSRRAFVSESRSASVPIGITLDRLVSSIVARNSVSDQASTYSIGKAGRGIINCGSTSYLSVISRPKIKFLRGRSLPLCNSHW